MTESEAAGRSEQVSGVAAPTEPSHAERARTLTEAVSRGALATTGDGYPYCSAANVVVDEQGRPLTFVSTMAPHTRNLLERPRASLLLAEQDAAGRARDGDALALGRVTLQGDMALVDRGGAEHARARGRYLVRHPQAAYVDYGDFLCFRLDVVALRYVGGFGRMSWVDVAAYAAAEPDPLSEVAPGAVEHMNADHAGGLVLCAQAFGGAVDAHEAQMTALDRYGFELVVGTRQGQRALRIGFPEPVNDPGRLRQAMAALVRSARTALG